MYNCKNCGEEIIQFTIFCQSCGQKASPPAEEAEGVRRVLQALKSTKESVTTPLDTSLRGLTDVRAYIDDVIRDITLFQKLMLDMLEHHKKARKKPRLFRKKKWQESALLHIGAMDFIIRAVPTRESGKIEKRIEYPHYHTETTHPFPPGCFFVGRELGNIFQATVDFNLEYARFMAWVEKETDRGNIQRLERCSENLAKIAEYTGKAMVEVERVREQVQQALPPP